MKKQEVSIEFDLEGLQTDFPTAKDLERFVYDQTGIVLNLKGRSNALKYQAALDVLNGREIDDAFMGAVNPYLDKADLIPEDPLKPVPARSSSLPSGSPVHTFFWKNIPHPDREYNARNKKVNCQFRKYSNGMISYEVLGPIEPRPEGMKIDKFGKERPEIIRWVDPRTGEQMMRDKDGSYTEVGNRLRGVMIKDGVWSWVDRDVLAGHTGQLRDVWGTGNE